MRKNNGTVVVKVTVINDFDDCGPEASDLASGVLTPVSDSFRESSRRGPFQWLQDFLRGRRVKQNVTGEMLGDSQEPVEVVRGYGKTRLARGDGYIELELDGLYRGKQGMSVPSDYRVRKATSHGVPSEVAEEFVGQVLPRHMLPSVALEDQYGKRRERER